MQAGLVQRNEWQIQAAPFSGLLALGPDDRASRRPSEKRVADEAVDDLLAEGRIQVPQTRGLRRRELETGHFEELAPHALYELLILHRTLLSRMQMATAENSSKSRATTGPAPRLHEQRIHWGF
jgi:hypothetical protein